MRFRKIVVAGCLTCGLALAAVAEDRSEAVVATVNGVPITRADLEAEYLVRRIPDDQRERLRERLVNELVDRRLIAEFLDTRKAPVPEGELEAQIELLKRAVEASQGSWGDLLARLGLTEDSLRAHLALPLRWRAFVRRTVTDDELRAYFESRRAEFDGTQVRVRQIVLSVPADAEQSAWDAAAMKLGAVRQSIIGGEVTFEEAARRHSTSPSAKQGGDVGWISFRGRLPPALCAAAFALELQAVSDVLRTPFGVHLLQVTERKAGEFSLEDVREEVWEQRTRDFWAQQVEQARQTATIESATAP